MNFHELFRACEKFLFGGSLFVLVSLLLSIPINIEFETTSATKFLSFLCKSNGSFFKRTFFEWEPVNSYEVIRFILDSDF